MCAVIAACSSSSSPTISDGSLARGQWGGDSAAMIVGDTSVHLHISCTYGDVSGRITIRDDGTFDVAGSYLLRAFPIAIGPTLPARFSGRIDRQTATIVVTVNDTVNKQTVVRGPVRVTLGQEPRLLPCPICASRFANERAMTKRARD